MATTDNCIQYDEVFFDEFGKYVLSPEKMAVARDLASEGLLQRERLVEMAISAVSGIPMDSTAGRDHADGSDTKTVVSSYRNSDKRRGSWALSFPVRNIASKTGDLRIVAYNRLQEKFHYFYIPHKEYQHLTGVLEIIIERKYGVQEDPGFTGEPKRHRKWWNFEVESFEALCAIRQTGE